MSNFLLMACLFVSLASLNAQAGFLIEPEVGYATGSIKAEYTELLGGVNLSNRYGINGLNYGGKAGFTLGSFQLLAEYVHNSTKSNGDDFEINETAALLAYRFNFFRIYGGYIFGADAKDIDTDGTGLKAGFSFYALRNMALNLEYRMVKLDDVDDEDGGTGYTSYDYQTFAILLSFPFQLL